MAPFKQGSRPSKRGKFVSGTCWPYPALPEQIVSILIETAMLWTIAVILIVLWLLGVVIHIGGGLIHILLVIAIIVVLVRLFTGRSV